MVSFPHSTRRVSETSGRYQRLYKYPLHAYVPHWFQQTNRSPLCHIRPCQWEMASVSAELNHRCAQYGYDECEYGEP